MVYQLYRDTTNSCTVEIDHAPLFDLSYDSCVINIEDYLLSLLLKQTGFKFGFKSET